MSEIIIRHNSFANIWHCCSTIACIFIGGNFFLHSEALYWGITYIGVLVFVGLITYDTQKIKALATLENNEHTQKLAICGAPSLYLDFINLFLMLLRIMGRRRQGG